MRRNGKWSGSHGLKVSCQPLKSTNDVDLWAVGSPGRNRSSVRVKSPKLNIGSGCGIMKGAMFVARMLLSK